MPRYAPRSQDVGPLGAGRFGFEYQGSDDKMPVRSTPEMATQKWVTNLSGATERMKAGALAVKESPGVSAAAAADKWLARVTASKDKFIRNSRAVTKESWIQSYTTTGISRVAQGAQDKRNKMLDFQTQFLPYLAAGSAQIDKMPTNTLEDGVNKAAAQIRYNAKFVRNAGR